MSADEIESQMRADGQPVSRSDIDEWLVQAEHLAAAVESPVEAIATPARPSAPP